MKRITISFDDGPEARSTGHVLDVLARRGIKTTFFVIGQNMEDPADRAMAERAVAEGHLLGGHSYRHKTPMGWMQDPEDAIAEIDLCTAAIGALATPGRLFRPFGAGGINDTRLLNPVGVEHLKAGGYTVIIFDLSPGEWRDRRNWPDKVMAACAENDWPVVAVRDVEYEAMQQLDSLFDRLADAGVEVMQEFPERSYLLRDGEVVGDLVPYIGLRETPPQNWAAAI